MPQIFSPSPKVHEAEVLQFNIFSLRSLEMRSLPVAVSVSDLSLSARRRRRHRRPGGTPTPTVGVWGRVWRGTAHAPLASVQSLTLRSEIVFMTDRFIFWNILHRLLRQSSSWWLGPLRLLTHLTHCVRNFWAKKMHATLLLLFCSVHLVFLDASECVLRTRYAFLISEF